MIDNTEITNDDIIEQLSKEYRSVRHYRKCIDCGNFDNSIDIDKNILLCLRCRRGAKINDVIDNDV